MPVNENCYLLSFFPFFLSFSWGKPSSPANVASSGAGKPHFVFAQIVQLAEMFKAVSCGFGNQTAFVVFHTQARSCLFSMHSQSNSACLDSLRSKVNVNVTKVQRSSDLYPFCCLFARQSNVCVSANPLRTVLFPLQQSLGAAHIYVVAL